MDIHFCMRLVIIGIGVIALVTAVELSTHIVRDKLGLDKEYYIITCKNKGVEDKIFKTNEVKIDIRTNVIKFRDSSTGKMVEIEKDYTYKEVSKTEWLSIDNK